MKTCSKCKVDKDLSQFYYNLQYLTPEDNLAKSDKLDGILI